jgi:membrane protein
MIFKSRLLAQPEIKELLMFDKFRSDDAGTNKAVLVFRVLRQCGRLLVLNRCGTQAAALAYHTMFGIIPLAIVMLMVFQMFPASKSMGDKVRQMIYEQMNLHEIYYSVQDKGNKPADMKTVPELKKDSNEITVVVNAVENKGENKLAGAKAGGKSGGDPNKITLADKIDEITGQYVSNLSTGAITFVGGLLTIWAAIGLLTTIEKSFNTIWGVPKSRDILHRTINYWAILTLGPLLLGLGIYLSTNPTISRVLEFSAFHFIGPVFSFVLSAMLIFCLYVFLPNAKVRIPAAIIGAMVAAILWMAAKFGFGIYVTKLIPYQSVYGVMGLIPLTVFWIYIIWWVVLLGLQLTYATQHVYSLDKAEKMARLRAKQASFVATDQTVIQIMREILVAFEDKSRKPITPSEISDATALSEDFVERILDNLTRAGLLCRTTEPIVGYVPSTDGAHITLADISLAVEKSSFQTQNPKLQQIFARIREELAKHNLKDIL